MNRVLWKILIIHALFYLLMLLLYSCGLLKNTSREKSSLVQESQKHTASQELNLSRVYRESQIYSYRPDGSVAVLEQRQEQMDAASFRKLQSEERVKEKATELSRQSSPSKYLLALVPLMLCGFGYLIMKKYL